MGFFSSVWKGVKNTVKSVGKVAGGAVKAVGGVASTAVKAIPGVGQIYDAATTLVGVDPLKAVANTVGGVVGGGNIGKDISAGLQEAITGGLVAAFFPSKVEAGDQLPDTSTDPPGVYTYEDGTYAYTVNPGGKVTYNPADMNAPPATAVESPNGSLSPIPSSVAAKAIYVQQLLDSYGDPLGVDKVNMTMSAVNNYVVGINPLDGKQQSNLIALDVVNKEPEALAYTAQALSQASGKSAVDWIALLTGLWNTAKSANIPGVSDTVKKAEDQMIGVAGQFAAESISQRIARFIRDNMLLVFGGVVLLFGLLFFAFGRRSN